jgi:hypothetical protein
VSERKKLSESRATTLLGGSLGIGTLVLALLPAEVRAGCVEAIQNSNNPVFIAIMALGAIVLTVIGPSITAKNAKTSNGQEANQSTGQPQEEVDRT